MLKEEKEVKCVKGSGVGTIGHYLAKNVTGGHNEYYCFNDVGCRITLVNKNDTFN